MKRSLFLFAIALVPLLLPVAAVATDVTADFTYGNDDMTYVDAFPGIPGDGWINAWQTKPTLATATSTVINGSDLMADPLASGTGNYLDVAVVPTDVGGGCSVGRDFAGSGGLDGSLDHTLSFLFRVDEGAINLTDTFTGLEDRYQIYDDPTMRNGSAASVRWLIGAYGAGDGTSGSGVNPGDAGYWLFYNGLNDGVMDPNRQVNTGIALQSGHTLQFDIAVHPAAQTWDATITDLDTSDTFSQTAMGWRVDNATNPSASGLVQFFARGDSASADVRHYSLDSLHAAGTYLPPGQAVRVAAHFNDGNTTAAIDGYQGIAGGGWATAWKSKTSNATNVSTVVTAADAAYDELAAGKGNYLNVSVESTAVGGGYAAGRDYTGTDGIDPAVDHTVKFLYRVDESTGALESTFTGSADRYQIYDDPTIRAGTSSSCRWIIGAYGLGDGSEVNSADAGYWLLYNGAGDGTSMVASRQVNTGIELASGHTLSFEIDIHAADHTWDATITDLDTLESFTQLDMGWRSNIVTAPEVSGLVQFFGRGDSTSGDLRQFSVDELIINQGDMPSVPGDTNNDGNVDATDAQTLAAHWGATGIAGGATVGDFNGDSTVNAADASILAAHWSPAPSEAGAVPEPSTMLLLLGALVSLLLTRRNQH